MRNENACTMTNICVSDDVNIYIRWNENVYSIKRKCGRGNKKCVSMVKRKYEYDESAPTAGGVFVVYFVGIYGLFGE